MTVNLPNKPPEGRALNLFASAVQLDAAEPAEDGAAPKLRRFSMTAYTGGAMQLAGWRYPVVVDVQGLALGKQQRPILFNHTHDVDFVLGQTDSIAVLNQQLIVAGQIMGESPKARQVIVLNDNGFAWQASIGAKAEQIEFVAEGKSVTVNGQEFHGPLNVARRAMLGEISFVVLGADDNTSAQIAAAAAHSHKESKQMDYPQWLAAQGFSEDHLSDAQAANMRSLFERELAATSTDGTVPTARMEATTAVADLRAEFAAETARVAKVRKICGNKFPEIEARSIAEGWDETRTELEVLRASRPHGPAIHGAAQNINAQSMEAALCLSAGLGENRVGQWFDDRTMEAALSRDLRGAGLHSLMYEVIRASGEYIRPGKVDNEFIRAAFRADQRAIQAAAGFSTLSLSGILSNTANKTMLAAYEAVGVVWPKFCATTDHGDFKIHTRYRLTGSGQYQQVGPAGELKHHDLSEQSYTNQIDTYGILIALTRKMMIDDDLAAFLQIPRIQGRMAGIKLEKSVFELILANPNNFFSSGNKNYVEGAATALSIESLTNVEQKFLDQTDTNGDPILVTPKILLLPTGLKTLGHQLMTETRVNETTTSGKPSPANNPHAGKWEAVASPFLNAQNLAGQSATAWYLFADPQDLAAVEVAFLRGQRVPTIESAESDFSTLGMQWRSYHDFGVALQDHRAAVKSKGAA